MYYSIAQCQEMIHITNIAITIIIIPSYNTLHVSINNESFILYSLMYSRGVASIGLDVLELPPPPPHPPFCLPTVSWFWAHCLFVDVYKFFISLLG